MAEPNWDSTELHHVLRVEMTDPVYRESTFGALDVVSDSADITMDITTDTIAQASVDVVDWNQWIDNSWIRFVHEIPESQYRRVLGTFFVFNEGRSFNYNSLGASPTLYSSLKTLTLDSLPKAIFIGEGAPVTRVIASILDPAFVRYIFDGSCGEYYYTSTYVIDAGTTRMDALKSVLKDVGWEYTLNGDGSITFKRFEAYSTRSWTYTLDAQAKKSVIEENTLKPEDTNRSVPGRSIVIWKGDDSEDEPVTAYADVDPSNPASPQRRGYIVSEVHELSDLSGERTTENALVYARNFLEKDATPYKRWSMKTLWLPISAGDVIMFRSPESSNFVRSLVENVKYDFSKWKLELTIKEVPNE